MSTQTAERGRLADHFAGPRADVVVGLATLGGAQFAIDEEQGINCNVQVLSGNRYFGFLMDSDQVPAFGSCRAPSHAQVMLGPMLPPGTPSTATLTYTVDSHGQCTVVETLLQCVPDS